MSNNCKSQKKILNRTIVLAVAGLVYLTILGQICKALPPTLCPDENQLIAAFKKHTHLKYYQMEEAIGKEIAPKKKFSILIHVGKDYINPSDILNALASGKDGLNPPSITAQQEGRHTMFGYDKDSHKNKEGKYTRCDYTLTSGKVGTVSIDVEE